MSARLIELLLRLEPRERVLVGVLVLLVLPVALGVGVLWPLVEERRAAERELAEARALDIWVQERQVEMAGLSRPLIKNENHEAVGISAVEQSLIARRLRKSLTELETGDSGEIVLRFDSVEFTDLMRWLDSEDPEWGYEINSLRMERTDRPAWIAARLTLTPANAP